MTRDCARQIATEYMKPVYSFALKRCVNMQDAEDLTQEICLKIYRALLLREDIDSVDKFVWTAAHNALANYYRGKQKSGIGVPIDELVEAIPSGDDVSASLFEKEMLRKLHSEIAYLSRLQRKIVIAYYYENKKQDEIANMLGIPLGTVKWHLFEAKKDLKKGMVTMRQSSELKFNPIHFELCGTWGSIGTGGRNSNFFRSALSQNIAYCVRQEAKTINEIANDLGVSPVYVESEADYLAEYGFLLIQGGKYIINILLDEPTDELIHLHDEMYQQAAKIFANELFNELTNSDILNSDGIVCNQPEHLTLTSEAVPDRNYILWSLIPYIAALSGEKLMDTAISFEEAMTVRPDGGQNICVASILNPEVKPPLYFDSMKNWHGPMWNANENLMLWQVDSEWSEKRADDNYQNAAKRDLTLLEHVIKGEHLSKDEYAYLCEKGYLKISGGIDRMFKSSLQIVWIRDIETKRKLISIGDRIKEKHKAEFDALKAPLVKVILDSTPKHLRKMRGFGLQYIFYSDGWFLLHCIKELVGSGKLKLPTEEQKKSLTTILAPSN